MIVVNRYEIVQRGIIRFHDFADACNHQDADLIFYGSLYEEVLAEVEDFAAYCSLIMLGESSVATDHSVLSIHRSA